MTDLHPRDDGYPEWLSALRNIADGIEDEGDRTYFGSTNDADELKAVVEALVNASYPDRYFKRPDFHKHNAELIERNAALEAKLATAREALERCAKIVRENNWRQNEKVDDVVLIARAALDAIKDDGRAEG